MTIRCRWRIAHHEVQVRGYVHDVVIGCGTEVIARHQRSYGKADMVFDPLHLSAAAGAEGRCSRSSGTAFKGWDLPSEAFATLYRLLAARMGNPGKREYVQVLRLLETFSRCDDLHGAIQQASEARCDRL